MNSTPDRAAGRLVRFGLLIVGGFLLGTAYAEWRRQPVKSQADALMADTVPSIVQLIEIEAGSERLAASLAQLVDVPQRPANPQSLSGASATEQIRRALDAYRPLATWGDKRAIFAALERQCERMFAERSEILALVGANEMREARRRMRVELIPNDAEMATTIERLVRLNLQEAQHRSSLIASAQRNAEHASIVLGIAALVLALLSGSLFVRATQREARLRAEHEALREERATELEQFAERAAHDIVGPLATTRLAIDTAIHQREDAAHARESLERGLRTLDRASRVITALLEFSKAAGAPDHRARARIDAVARESIDECRPLAERTNVTLALGRCDSAEAVCDPELARIVLTNLIANAIKYMGDAATREVAVSVTAVESRVRVEVDDSGPGVAPEWRDRIFRPYVRGPGGVQSPGVGLGLATAKRTVEAHGGRIGVRPSSRGGSCFWFELPQLRESEATDDRGALRESIA